MKNSILRRILTICCLCCTLTVVRAQYLAIPDTNFGNWLYNNGYAAAMTGSSAAGWQLDFSNSLVYNTTYINCDYSNIYDLDGIQYFASLHSLSCANNHLTSIPALFPFLTYLNCAANQLSSLPSPLPDSLLTLDCSNNPLYTLPGLPAGLTNLSCGSCRLTTLPNLPPALETLDCFYNNLTTLPTLPATLTGIKCDYNRLTFLPALPSSLYSIDCGSNMIDSLPALPGGLWQLLCEFNRLTTLPALNPGLTQLFCASNRLTTLPSLPASLTWLSVENNQLTSLPTLPPYIENLYCSVNPVNSLPTLPSSVRRIYCAYNQLSVLPVLPDSIDILDCHSNPALTCMPPIRRTSRMTLFNADSTNITCLPNRVTAYHFGAIDPSFMPLCDPTSGCDFYYNIAGNIHSDTATTCALDSLHPGTPITNVKVQLKQGGNVIQQLYTANSGNYSFKVPYGSYTIAIDTASLPLSIVCPQSGVRGVTISAIDSIKKYEDFGMQCAAIDFGVYHMSGVRFRPTFTTVVHVDAGNIALIQHNTSCGGGTSGTVTTTFTNAVQYAGPAPGALTPSSVSGNTLTYNIADLNTLQAGSLDFILSVDTGAVPGSQICITTTVTPSIPDAVMANNNLTQCFKILHSWDPNYKEVSPEQIEPGATDWLTYTIHFQNTGSDTAYLVVLKDTLSQYVDAASFQYLASSHHAVVQLDHNAMTFTFPHINLVDSATNPPLSEGWIQYRIKANPGLTNGTAINNTAYIYFDNNPAVVTNTASTNVTAAVACTDTTIYRSVTLCYGDTFYFAGGAYATTDTFIDIFSRAGGCDSTYIHYVTVLPQIMTMIDDTICSGSSVSFAGQSLTGAGMYMDTLTAAGGCDSIIMLMLEVRAVPAVTFKWDSLIQSHRIQYRNIVDSTVIWCDYISYYLIPLTGGMPAGGTYSGEGIQNDTLDGHYFLQHHLPAWSSWDTITYTYTDQHGCSNSVTDSIVITVCEGINDIETNNIQLYPNPNNGSFTLQTSNSGNSSYMITNMLGKVIAEDMITSDVQTIDMHDAAAGVYTLTLKGTQTSRQARFVVVK